MKRDLVHAPPTDTLAMRAAARSPMERIFYSHEGATSDKWHHYLDVYDRHLARFRGSPVRLLEIGVQEGGSFSVWRSYLGPRAVLHGLDIAPAATAASALDEAGAVLHVGDQTDAALLARIASEMGGVDVVIDDGGHIWGAQIDSFEILYPLLSADGIYICEDTHTSYWPEYAGKARASFIEYAKRKVDELHAWHTDGVASETFARRTRSVLFYDSLVVFERGVRSPPRRCIVGPVLRQARAPKRLALVHLVRAANGIDAPTAFFEAYRRTTPGAEHDLVVACKGFEGALPEALTSLWADFDPIVLRLPDEGFDLGSYRAAAEQLGSEYVCFVNSFSRPLAPHWLQLLFDVADRPGVGLAGATGSHEIDLHIRTNAFCIRREMYLDLVSAAPRSKLDACAIEAGPDSLTRLVHRAGLTAYVVDAAGEAHDVADAASVRASATFRSEEQAALLVADNRTDAYARADRTTRTRLEALAWGPPINR